MPWELSLQSGDPVITTGSGHGFTGKLQVCPVTKECFKPLYSLVLILLPKLLMNPLASKLRLLSASAGLNIKLLSAYAPLLIC